jgi:hypothetical protein
MRVQAGTLPSMGDRCTNYATVPGDVIERAGYTTVSPERARLGARNWWEAAFNQKRLCKGYT